MKMMSKLQSHAIVFLMITTTFVPATAQINLALHGTASQDTTYTDSDGNSYSANLAIEGPANNNWADGCSSTAAGQVTQWWGIFFPKLVYITNITYYLRNETAVRMNGFRLYFANGTVFGKTERCFGDYNNQAYRNLIHSVDCDLSPTKNVYFFNRYTYVELCYIEINGCWKGFWGKNCTVPCPPTCIGKHCYPANGSCVWGCDHTNCMNKNCSKATGVCLGGCAFGQAGQYCNKYNVAYNQTAKIMPTGQSNAMLSVDGLVSTCISFSSPGTSYYLQVEFGSLGVITTLHFVFGDNTTANDGQAVFCSNTTDKWNDGILLYNGPRLDADITIFAICKYVTYVSPMLSGNSMVELCEMEIGGCQYGRYGENCEHVCPENCFGQGPCDLVSGNCSSGCLDGWVGAKCDQACIADTFGNECLLNCSKNCLSPPCNHVTGECDRGCNRGWERLNCTDKCSKGKFGWNCTETCDGCIVNECNHINGVCKIDSVCKPGFVYGKYCNKMCDDWLFGTNCNMMCYCLEKPCNIFTGECSDDGCKKGWKGDSCDQECSYGYFGFNCAYRCETCFNQSCDIFEGNCRVGCNDGYRGRKCETQVSAGSLSLIKSSFFMVGFASMLGILLVILTVVVARRRMLKKQESRKGLDNSHSNSNEQHYDDIMKMESVSTYQDLARQTINLSSDYDQINNAYTNQ